MKNTKIRKMLRGLNIDLPLDSKEVEELQTLLHNLGYKWANGESLYTTIYDVEEYTHLVLSIEEDDTVIRAFKSENYITYDCFLVLLKNLRGDKYE